MKKLITVTLLIAIATISFAQVKKIPFTGTNVNVEVSGSLIYSDIGLAYDDPMAGVVIYYTDNGEDGSQEVMKVAKGTTYYKSQPDAFSFQANSDPTSKFIYVFAFTYGGGSASSLKGKYVVKVNGTSYDITASNIISLTQFNISTSIIDEGGEKIPNNFSIKQNYPNPFNPNTQIEYTLEKTSDVEISVYDITGKLIKNLITTQQDRGSHKVIWDAKNEKGEAVSSGTYIYQITANKNILAKKMLHMK